MNYSTHNTFSVGNVLFTTVLPSGNVLASEKAFMNMNFCIIKSKKNRNTQDVNVPALCPPGTVQESVEQGNNCVQYDYRFDCTISTPVTTICRVIGIPGFQASSRLNIITAAGQRGREA